MALSPEHQQALNEWMSHGGRAKCPTCGFANDWGTTELVFWINQPTPETRTELKAVYQECNRCQHARLLSYNILGPF